MYISRLKIRFLWLFFLAKYISYSYHRARCSKYLSEWNKNTNSKRYLHYHVYCSIIYNSWVCKTTCVNQRMYKEIVIYICHILLCGIYWAIEGMKYCLVIPWMNHEGVMLSEIIQTEKDKHCMTSLTCGN